MEKSELDGFKEYVLIYNRIVNIEFSIIQFYYLISY